MSRTEIRITGYGGQGVVLSGHIIGHAAAINAGLHATMIQSFGPEARGSACSTTLVVSPDSSSPSPRIQGLTDCVYPDASVSSSIAYLCSES